MWRFGYGSNLSVLNLKKKKNLNVIEHHTGFIKGFQLSFGLKGISHVDPAFASVKQVPGAEVHGLAFKISEEEAKGLDKQEVAYNCTPVPFTSYTGEELTVGIYLPKNPPTEEYLPSKRYLGLLQKGAKEAGLDQKYVDILNNQKYYVTPKEVRDQSNKWIEEFENSSLSQNKWTFEKL